MLSEIFNYSDGMRDSIIKTSETGIPEDISNVAELVANMRRAILPWIPLLEVQTCDTSGSAGYNPNFTIPSDELVKHMQGTRPNANQLMYFPLDLFDGNMTLATAINVQRLLESRMYGFHWSWRAYPADEDGVGVPRAYPRMRPLQNEAVIIDGPTPNTALSVVNGNVVKMYDMVWGPE